MLWGSIIIGLIFIVALIFYKRDLFVNMFSIHLTSQTSRFQEQLEETGDLVIKRLEEQIIHLEYLLEEANEKMTSLDRKIQTASSVLNKEHSEDEHAHLEQLLEVANEKMISLDRKIQIAHAISNKENTEDENVTIEIKPAAVNSNEKVKKEFTALSMDLYRDMPRKEKRSVIIEMTDLGYDITEIAKATGISKGEIMLLLQLNKK